MRYNFIFFLVFLGIGSLHAQKSENIKAKINLSQSDVFVTIDVVAENEGLIFENKLNYHLLTLKRGGTSKNYAKMDRHGVFEILPNEKKSIITLKLNIEKDQELKIYLFIKSKDQLIAQDSVKINEVKEIFKTTYLQEDEIEIKGLVVENVKTKIGKDFYDYFYQKYNSAGVKYASIIHIHEKPFMGGRGSLVSIEIDNDKIFEFQARPDEELLQNAAKYALKLIDNYAKNKKTFEKKYY